jgi:hypothetical protein
MELVTLPFAAQNEIWNGLKTGYEPSALYKVKMVIFEDEEPESLATISEAVVNVRTLI